MAELARPALIQWYCGGCKAYGSWFGMAAAVEQGVEDVAKAHRSASPACRDGADLHWSVSEMPYRARQFYYDRLAERPEQLPERPERLPERRVLEGMRAEIREEQQEREAQRREREERERREFERTRLRRTWEGQEQREKRERRLHALYERLDAVERGEMRFRKTVAPFERRELREPVSERDCPYFTEPLRIAPIPLDADEDLEALLGRKI